MINQKLEFIYPIKKEDLEEKIGYLKNQSFGHISVRENSEFYKKIKKFKNKESMSFAFVGLSDKKYCALPNYLIHYIQIAEFIIQKKQEKEVLFSNYELFKFITKNFKENRLYTGYSIRIIFPSMDINQYLLNKSLDLPYSKLYRLTKNNQIIKTMICN